ncbi:MAG: hypothetical protein ACTIKR_14340 [Advenella sp.]
MKENTTITVVIDTIARGPTTENIAVIGHTTGAITVINVFC